MRVHITNINGIAHNSAASICQYNSLKIGREMGFDEMGIYKILSNWDSGQELSKRLDGIIAPLWHDDIVILQLPTWCDLDYTRFLIRKIKAYNNVKIIMFIHDVAAIQMNADKNVIEATVKIYNEANVLILPSRKMYEKLVTYGLNVDRIVYQELWDYPMSHSVSTHKLIRKVYFTGDADRFPFVKSWKYKTTLELFGGTQFDLANLNVHMNGYKESIQLISDIGEGGFGLVWADDDGYEYYKINQPIKIATYLAAGIPVLVREGCNVADYVLKNKVGFVINSLDEIDDIVENITDDEYGKLLNNVRKSQFLITNGCYTRKVLNDAVIMALEEK